MKRAVAVAAALLFSGSALHAQRSAPDTTTRGEIRVGSPRVIGPTRPAIVDMGFGWRHRTGEPYLIAQVRDDSPASRAGLRDGDALLTVDGHDPNEDGVLFPNNAPGRRYRLLVRRGDQEMELEIVSGPPRARPNP